MTTDDLRRIVEKLEAAEAETERKYGKFLGFVYVRAYKAFRPVYEKVCLLGGVVGLH